jgi:hypothetical protein
MHSPRKVSVESTTTVLTPAFSVKTWPAERSLEPVAERVGAGEVDQLHSGRERAREPVGGVLGGERHEVRVEARLGQHLLGHLHGDRKRQHGTGVGLDDDRVAADE